VVTPAEHDEAFRVRAEESRGREHGAIYLIVELDQPFEGLMRLSSAPLRAALDQLGQ